MLFCTQKGTLSKQFGYPEFEIDHKEGMCKLEAKTSRRTSNQSIMQNFCQGEL